MSAATPSSSGSSCSRDGTDVSKYFFITALATVPWPDWPSIHALIDCWIRCLKGLSKNAGRRSMAPSLPRGPTLAFHALSSNVCPPSSGPRRHVKGSATLFLLFSLVEGNLESPTVLQASLYSVFSVTACDTCV